MSFFRFEDEDIIDTDIVAHPSYTVELNGDAVTGSVYLDKPFLSDELETRTWRGLSLKLGGLIEKQGPFTASIDIVDAEEGATNKQLYRSVLNLYDYYSLLNEDYTSYFTGSETTRFRIITVPEIYYEREILTGSFTASDLDSSGNSRVLYDNGRGGIYSGSVSGTLVGNIFYSEGLVVLKGGGLNDETAGDDFGQASPTNYKWTCDFKGVNKIPVKIFRCRAPTGMLNATTNDTYSRIPAIGSGEDFIGEKVRIFSSSFTYVTGIGLYNDRYELVGVAKLAQPIRKEEHQSLLFRIRIDQ